MIIEQWTGIEPLMNQIARCEKAGHKQQVCYSTYEKAFTQIDFTCNVVRTTLILPKDNGT
jgi:hypothetical protein